MVQEVLLSLHKRLIWKVGLRGLWLGFLQGQKREICPGGAESPPRWLCTAHGCGQGRGWGGSRVGAESSRRKCLASAG